MLSGPVCTARQRGINRLPFQIVADAKSPYVDLDGRLIQIESSQCVGCGLCMMACSWIKAKQFNPLKAFVDIQRDIEREGDWDAQFTESCDACGFCAQWCHYDAIEFTKASKRSEMNSG